MPRYYFHLREESNGRDEEGVELADEAAAREHALETARDVVCARIHEQRGIDLDHSIEVTNERQDHILTVTFRESFTIVG